MLETNSQSVTANSFIFRVELCKDCVVYSSWELDGNESRVQVRGQRARLVFYSHITSFRVHALRLGQRPKHVRAKLAMLTRFILRSMGVLMQCFLLGLCGVLPLVRGDPNGTSPPDPPQPPPGGVLPPPGDPGPPGGAGVYPPPGGPGGGPQGNASTTPLWLLSLFPFSGAWPGGLGQLPAVEMGLRDVNADPTMLPGYTLHMTINDTAVSPIYVFTFSRQIHWTMT